MYVPSLTVKVLEHLHQPHALPVRPASVRPRGSSRDEPRVTHAPVNFELLTYAAGDREEKTKKKEFHEKKREADCRLCINETLVRTEILRSKRTLKNTRIMF